MREFVHLTDRFTIKSRLIIPLQLDPDLPDTSGKVSHTKRGFVFATTVALIVLVAVPNIVFGFLSFGKEIYESDTYGPSTRDIQLLSAIPNPTGNIASLGGGGISIIGDALLAQSGPSGTIAEIEGTKQSDRISVYVVREGDTLSQIAHMFGVSVNTLRWANDIRSSDTITPGEKLIILPVSGIQHKVKDGDTIKSIAKKYGGDIDEILNYNVLPSGASLAVGDTITIPNGEIATPVVTTSTPRPTVSGGPTYAGYYLRPIRGGYKSQGYHGYNGVDLATYPGAEIYASADGTVLISRTGSWAGGFGNYIVVEHSNGSQTLYAHNSSNIVSAGQRVVQGQVIGYVGNTGRSTGAHVHFEVRGASNPF